MWTAGPSPRHSAVTRDARCAQDAAARHSAHHVAHDHDVVGFPCGLAANQDAGATARMAQEQQSSASAALLGQLQFSVSARPVSGGCRLKKEKNDACS